VLSIQIEELIHRKDLAPSRIVINWVIPPKAKCTQLRRNANRKVDALNHEADFFQIRQMNEEEHPIYSSRMLGLGKRAT
jgi:hypothetical protein